MKHTSNSADNLLPTGYRGAPLYQDQPEAVVDGKIVAAPGTATVSFMAGVMQTLGLRDDSLNFYIGMYSAEHKVAYSFIDAVPLRQRRTKCLEAPLPVQAPSPKRLLSI